MLGLDLVRYDLGLENSGKWHMELRKKDVKLYVSLAQQVPHVINTARCLHPGRSRHAKKVRCQYFGTLWIKALGYK